MSARADQYADAVAAALKDGNIEAAVTLLRLMAVRYPVYAESLLMQVESSVSERLAVGAVDLSDSAYWVTEEGT